MRKILLITFLTIFTVQLNAQSVEEKIINLLELDGTFNNIENLINETIEQQKKENIGVSDQYWNDYAPESKELFAYGMPVYKKLTKKNIGILCSI